MPRHGTEYAYELMCRCAACVTYHNGRVKQNRADRLASGNLNHGTRSAYDAGCRCPQCKHARRLAYRLLEKRDPALSELTE